MQMSFSNHNNQKELKRYLLSITITDMMNHASMMVVVIMLLESSNTH